MASINNINFMKALKVSNYVAPRKDPLIHPGKRPPTSYIMDGNNNIFLMRDIDKGARQAYIETLEGQVSVNDFLKRHQVDSLEERIPVMGYGTNPCPGQLEYKFRPISNLVVPVIKGSIKGWDTVYKFISNAGYAYAQLIPSKDVTVEAWITLLDQVQYERMNWTEGVLNKDPDYHVGVLPNFQIEHSGQFETMVYIGDTKIFLSPECSDQRNTPISIAEIAAEGRRTPALFQEEVLNHGLDIFHLHNFLQAYKDALELFTGSPGKKLAYYLNEHFNLHNGGEFQCNRCAKLLVHIFELAESQHCQEVAVSERLEIKRTLLINPNRSPFRFGNVWH